MSDRPDILNMFAKERLALNDSWQLLSWRRLDPNGILVTIGKARAITKGKKKGSNTWTDTKGNPLSERKEVFLTYGEIKEREERWEKDTGKCIECGGDGQAWIGWSLAEGNRYATCRKCNGKGMLKP